MKRAATRGKPPRPARSQRRPPWESRGPNWVVIGLGILLLVVIIGGGGFLLVRSRAAARATPTPTITPTPTNTATPRVSGPP